MSGLCYRRSDSHSRWRIGTQQDLITAVLVFRRETREERRSQKVLLYNLLVQLRTKRLHLFGVVLTEEKNVLSRIPGQIPNFAVLNQGLDQVKHI
jgi:hypothetical protein